MEIIFFGMDQKIELAEIISIDLTTARHGWIAILIKQFRRRGQNAEVSFNVVSDQPLLNNKRFIVESLFHCLVIELS